MALVITMAGKNTRFHDAGFDIPKYLLPWENGTVISTILRELTKEWKHRQVILLANRRDRSFRERLERSLAEEDLFNIDIRYIDDTIGQAHTAYLGIDMIEDKDEPFFIHNADTILLDRHLLSIGKILEGFLDETHAFLDVFAATSPKYSYIEVDGSNYVKSLSEKKVVSSYASSGLYGFRSASLYKEMYDPSKVTSEEFYISEVMNAVIRSGKKVRYGGSMIADDTIVLGSPEEYGLEFAKQIARKNERSLA